MDEGDECESEANFHYVEVQTGISFVSREFSPYSFPFQSGIHFFASWKWTLEVHHLAKHATQELLDSQTTVEAASNQVASNLWVIPWVIRDKGKVDVIHGNSPKRYLAYLAFC